MIIKKAKCEIIEVLSEEDHNIDDEGTKKALNNAKKTYSEKNIEKDKKSVN